MAPPSSSSTYQLSIVNSRTGTLASNVLPWLLATWTASKFPIYPARRSRTLEPDASSGVRPPNMLLCSHRWMRNVYKSMTKRTHILVDGHRDLCRRMFVLQAQKQMKHVLAFWRGTIRGSASRASVHTRRKPVLIPDVSSLWPYKEREKNAHCSEQLLQQRTTQSSNRRGKVPTTRARTRNLSTRLSLFRAREMVVKPSFRLPFPISPFHCFLLL